ncbi:MAG: bifunctional hydroxymethylpyrimidine kinase/phosphomethylpyrimidine kinase [Deltaproteobacteria bacterium]|nr:bifunctional hydroxymethylpyrimidine kinase/phosphomethylpyrimidine kinase [Deltaproteobacteria bacterium]
MSETKPPIALSVAGSDPTGGAGLQLDLRVFERHDVHGMAVATALTMQTTKGVHQVLPVFPSVAGEQLHVLLGDILPDAIKIGMLASDDVLLRVAMVLERYEIPRIVDPVMAASDGSRLLEQRALGNLCERILPGAALVTPNLSEAEALTGTRDPEAAARILLELGVQAALVKGGHASGPADDFLLTAEGGCWLRAPRLDRGPVHGTGCALSAAIAARVARGEGIEDAVRGAKDFVGRAIARAVRIGGGQRVLRFDDGAA